jgi:hypothetical protein
MKPIVLLSEYVISSGKFGPGPLVFCQERDPIENKPFAAIWIAFGEIMWFCGKDGTKELRDFCDAVLNDKQSALPSTVKRQTPDEVGSENVTIVDMTDDPQL